MHVSPKDANISIIQLCQ